MNRALKSILISVFLFVLSLSLIPTGVAAASNPPTPPTSANFVAPTISSLELYWSGATDDFGVTGYRLDVSTTPDFSTPLSGYSDLDIGPAYSWIIPNLAAQTTYYARVRAYDADMNISSDSPVAVGTTLGPDVMPPTAPTNVQTSSPTNTSMRISWQWSTDDRGLLLYTCNYSTNSDFHSPAYVTGIIAPYTSYIQTNLIPGATYFFRVQAQDTSGNVSPYSAVVSGATLPDTIAPSVPQNATLSNPTTTSMLLSWLPSSDNIRVQGYRVDVSTSPLFDSTLSAYTNRDASLSAMLTLTGLSPNTTYYARVRAYDPSGNVSGNSATAQRATSFTDLIPPSVPANVVVTTATQNTLTVDWAASSDNIGVTAYIVSLSQDPNFSSWSDWATVTQPGTTLLSLSGNTTYYIRVRARDAAGNVSAFSATASGMTLDTLPPSVPLNVALTNPTMNTLFLSWNPSSDNVGVVGYHYDISTSSGFQTFVTGYNDFNAGLTTSTTVSSLSAGTVYYARVRAYDAIGNMSFNSAIAQGMTAAPDVTPPSIPTNVAVPSTSRTTLTVTWTASTDDVAVVGYYVSLAIDPAFTAYSNWLSNNTTFFTLTGLSPNTTYYVKVRARDSSNNLSGFSAMASGMTQDTRPPSAPTNAALTNPTASSLVFSWTASTDTIGVAGYRFDVSTHTGFTPALSGYTDVDAGLVTSTSLTGLTSGATYFARVRAYDAALNLSGNSNTASAVTVTVDGSSPTVVISTPSSGAILLGTRLVSGSAADNKAVSQVSVWLDGSLLGNATGTTAWSYSLNTLAWPNGPHTLTVQATDPTGNRGSASVAITISNPSTAVYDATLKAPQCSGQVTSCDSGTLLNGRGRLSGGVEPHQPNTLYNSCVDGSAGSYHRDESIDRIRVFALDGGLLAPGKSVRVEVQVWASSSYSTDYLDLYYASSVVSPSWNYIGTVVPTGQGSRLLATTFTLPAGATQQAIRANFRDKGSVSPCTSGRYNDHDDLVFSVSNILTPPLVLDPGANAQASVAGDLGIPSALASVELRADAQSVFADARVFPNPWRADRHGGIDVTFDQLPNNSTIKIFTIAGEWVQTLNATSGSATWNRRNSAGDQVGSGIYFYLITDSSGEKSRGQLALIQ